MNNYSLIVLLILTSLFSCRTRFPPGDDTTRQNVASLVQQQEFLFKAQSVIPLTGRMRMLNPEYNLVIKQDSIICELPYIGRSYSAPIDPTRIGMNFISTNFGFSSEAKKKGGWQVVININDLTEVNQMRLDISGSGFASLQITPLNRQPVRYNGYITHVTNL